MKFVVQNQVNLIKSMNYFVHNLSTNHSSNSFPNILNVPSENNIIDTIDSTKIIIIMCHHIDDQSHLITKYLELFDRRKP